MSWLEELRMIQTEAAGVMRLDVVQPGDFSDLVGTALFGSPHSQRLVAAVEGALQQIAKAPRAKPRLCACCPRPIRTRGVYSIVIASPARDDTERALTLAVCPRCATEREEVREKAILALKRIWPDARSIAVHHQAGQA